MDSAILTINQLIPEYDMTLPHLDFFSIEENSNPFITQEDMDYYFLLTQPTFLEDPNLMFSSNRDMISHQSSDEFSEIIKELELLGEIEDCNNK